MNIQYCHFFCSNPQIYYHLLLQNTLVTTALITTPNILMRMRRWSMNRPLSSTLMIAENIAETQLDVICIEWFPTWKISITLKSPSSGVFFQYNLWTSYCKIYSGSISLSYWNFDTVTGKAVNCNKRKPANGTIFTMEGTTTLATKPGNIETTTTTTTPAADSGCVRKAPAFIIILFFSFLLSL